MNLQQAPHDIFHLFQVVEALRRIGKLEGAESLVRPALPCEQPLHYRNKMSFSLTSPQSPGGLSTGYGFKKVGSRCDHLTVCMGDSWPCFMQWRYNIQAAPV